MQTNYSTLLHSSMLTMLSLRSWLLTQSSVKYLLVKDKLQMSKCCQAIVAPSTTIKESWANNSFLFSLPLWCLVLSLFDSLVASQFAYAACYCQSPSNKLLSRPLFRKPMLKLRLDLAQTVWVPIVAQETIIWVPRIETGGALITMYAPPVSICCAHKIWPVGSLPCMNFLCFYNYFQ